MAHATTLEKLMAAISEGLAQPKKVFFGNATGRSTHSLGG
jgi:hypothetical protein